jgi:hypothetical protein
VAQAVSRRRVTVEAWGRLHVGPCGIYGGQSGNGALDRKVRLFCFKVFKDLVCVDLRLVCRLSCI